VCLRILRLVHMLVFLCLGDHFDLGLVPQLFRDDAFMQAIHYQVIILLDQLVFVAGAMHLFRFTAAISDLSAVHRVLDDTANKCGIKQRILSIMTGNLMDPVIFQILGKTIGADIRGDPLFKNGADRRSFLLIDLQYTILQAVSIRRKTTVPLAVPGFLNPALHGLDTNILTLDLCDC